MSSYNGHSLCLPIMDTVYVILKGIQTLPFHNGHNLAFYKGLCHSKRDIDSNPKRDYSVLLQGAYTLSKKSTD